jgi:hypothetical protein
MTSRRPNVAMTSADLGDYRTVACALFRFSDQAMAINESSSLINSDSEEKRKKTDVELQCIHPASFCRVALVQMRLLAS